MNQSAEITIAVNDAELDLIVNFDYDPGSPAVTHLAPEHCCPEEPETFEVTGLKAKRGEKWVDADFLIPVFGDDLIEKIKGCAE